MEAALHNDDVASAGSLAGQLYRRFYCLCTAIGEEEPINCCGRDFVELFGEKQIAEPARVLRLDIQHGVLAVKQAADKKHVRAEQKHLLGKAQGIAQPDKVVLDGECLERPQPRAVTHGGIGRL